VFNEELYIPRAAVIEDVRELTHDTRLYGLKFKSGDGGQREHSYRPGQFVQVSVLGVGEAPISICSSPTQKNRLELCIRKAGQVTSAIAELKAGDELGIRGPYGNNFGVEGLTGRDMVFIAGGIGLAPLRSCIRYVIDKLPEYGELTVLYGARTMQDIVFADELERWSRIEGVTVTTTIDKAQEGWSGNVGVVTTLIKRIKDKRGQKVFVCGPPIMIHFTVKEVLDAGWSAEDVITTLERHMKCGVGKCGHCYIGDKYVCTDGPVFSYAEIARMNVPV